MILTHWLDVLDVTRVFRRVPDESGCSSNLRAFEAPSDLGKKPQSGELQKTPIEDGSCISQLMVSASLAQVLTKRPASREQCLLQHNAASSQDASAVEV